LNSGACYFSPNGRVGRQLFWLCLAPLWVVARTRSHLPIVGTLIGLLLIYPWVCVYAKRLHDIGRTGWWTILPMVLAFAAKWTVVLGIAPVFYAELGPPTAYRWLWFTVAVLVNAAYLGAVLWIGVTKSAPGLNRFGPPPGKTTSQAMAETFS
jgi:uncharacterized membrane protein YhaH (DUF805 family)